MTLDGKGSEQIAVALTQDRILTPIFYWHSKGINRSGNVGNREQPHWNSSTIVKILGLQEYCGDVINFKTYSKSYKNKKRIPNTEEIMAIFRDVHEPVIDRATWETVQAKRGKVRKRAKSDDDRFAKMSKKYTLEQGKLQARIKALKAELEKQTDKTTTIDMFIASVRKYTRAKKLTERMLNELIERIEVHHAEKVDGVNIQRLVIHYNCIGIIEVPDLERLPEVDVLIQTRKGVAISYSA